MLRQGRAARDSDLNPAGEPTGRNLDETVEKRRGGQGCDGSRQDGGPYRQEAMEGILGGDQYGHVNEVKAEREPAEPDQRRHA